MFKKILIPSFYLCTCLFANPNNYSQLSDEEIRALPGRLNYQGVAVAEFGITRVFFYMSPEKYQLSHEFVEDTNENISHTIVTSYKKFPVFEVTPLVTKYHKPVGYDAKNNPIYLDPKGKKIFDEHAEKVKNIAEECLGVTIQGSSKNASLIINYDANKFHQDEFDTQYEFIKDHPHPIPKYVLLQDLVLIDWEMSDGTFSGTLVQDRESKDRFILPLFVRDVVCNVYTEPALYAGPDRVPEYPGDKTFPPHSPVPAMDFLGKLTPGSAKGKRISIAVRGVVTEEEMEDLYNRSQHLPVNRYQTDDTSRIYPNGILLKKIALDAAPSVHIGNCWQYVNYENVEVLETSPEDQDEMIEALKATFNIKCENHDVKVKHFIKKDGGFSYLALDELGIPKDSILVLVNSSQIPKDYEPFSIAEDFTKQGLPWMQFYHFPKNMAMLIPAQKLRDLALTPVEEIIFRNVVTDINADALPPVHEKINTRIDMFIFPLSTWSNVK